MAFLSKNKSAADSAAPETVAPAKTRRFGGEKSKAKSGEAKPARSKKSKGRGGNRFVLFIGDEGTILVHIKGQAVQQRQFVPDGSEASLAELRETLLAEPNAGLMLVVDNMDQTYIQQTLPPVSSLSVNKLISRRLERDFGPNDIKGAIVLGREKTGRKDWNFMMVSLERSPQIMVWLDFAASLPQRMLGIYLAAVETEQVLKNLESAMEVPKEGTGSEWKFVVSHNKVGGFRQVILRNGRIIFTRMAQPVGDSTPEVIAGNIEQEMLSTIEYMRRLSYNPSSGLDIYIIASSGIQTALDRSKFQCKNFHVLTPYETSQLLGIEGATQPTDQFGDVILAAAIGSSKKHVLRFQTPEFKKFDTLYHAIQVQRVLAALTVLGIFGYAGMTAYAMYSAYSATGELEDSKNAKHRSLENVKAQIQKTNTNVDAASDVIDLYQNLQKQSASAVPFFSVLNTALRPPVRLKSVDWTNAEAPSTTAGGNNPAAAAPGGAPASPPVGAAPNMPGMPGGSTGAAEPAQLVKGTAMLTVTFPPMEGDKFKTASQDLLAALKLAYKGADVSYIKLPAGVSENEKIDVTIGDGKEQEKRADMEAQIAIKNFAVPTPVSPVAQGDKP